jgi:hypothetical protein
MITFMFQTPGNYHLTARENIALGNPEEERYRSSRSAA